MKLETLLAIKAESERFNKRLDDAIAREKTNRYGVSGTKEAGALKRAALDLKGELTSITSPKY